MKTLYLSDLDGTLLRSNERISDFTIDTINKFVSNGGCFSYATARSFVTASQVTAGLSLDIPVVCYNGGFIFQRGEILLGQYFSSLEKEDISGALAGLGFLPIVYAFIDGVEYFSFIERDVSAGMRHFLDARLGDARRREVGSPQELWLGDVFYITCISTEKRLAPVHEVFKDDRRVNCIFHQDIYSTAWWCEILPVRATKAVAALELKRLLGCDKLVVFGDGINDVTLFSVADESYAMANAVEELKAMATGVIGSNDEDGVAHKISKREARFV